MNLSQQLCDSFAASCREYRDEGYTDISLCSNGKSHLRGPDGIIPIKSPSEAAMTHLVEVLLGEEKMEKMHDGGDALIIWNDMRVAVGKLAKTTPFHVVVRF